GINFQVDFAVLQALERISHAIAGGRSSRTSGRIEGTRPPSVPPSVAALLPAGFQLAADRRARRGCCGRLAIWWTPRGHNSLPTRTGCGRHTTVYFAWPRPGLPPGTDGAQRTG